MPSLADQLISILESKVPAGIADDEDLTPVICPSIGDMPLESIYEDISSDPLASYAEADGYDILSIERYGGLVTTELRILHKQSSSECRALLFNKYL